MNEQLQEIELRLSTQFIAVCNQLIRDATIGETGNMLLQHIGLFYALLELQLSNRIVTTSLLVDELKVDRTSLLRQLRVLENAGLISRAAVPGVGGRGRGYSFQIVPDYLTAQLQVVTILKGKDLKKPDE